MSNNFLSQLPRPVRFGLFGAAGGLIGALLIGELVWRLLEPPPPPPPPPPSPRLAVSVTPDVLVYQGGKNTFTLNFDSDQLSGASITISFTGQPSGVSIASLSGTDRGTRDSEVAVARAVPPGVYPVTTTATATTNGESVTATAVVQVRVDPLPKPSVDVVFVLDVTSSMQPAIDGVRDGIKAFAEGLDPERIDFRIGLVAFRDWLNGEPSEVLKFGKEGETFTTDSVEFKRQVSRLTARGGGDPPESSLDAICEAAELSFRPKATKVLLLITDAPPKLPDMRIRSVKEAEKILRERHIDQLHIVANPDEQRRGDRRIRNIYEQLWGGPTGQFFDLQQISTGRDSFNRLLPELSRMIATAATAARATDARLSAAPPPAALAATQGLQSSRAYDARAGGRLLAAISCWTAAITAGISLALAAIQYLSLNRRPPPTAVLLGLAGGAVAGLIGGAVGQGLFALAPSSSVVGVMFRVVGWSALGALAGGGLAFVVPNLRKSHGVVGGAIGGGVGALGFSIASGIGLGDTIGRVAGAVILGFFIGLMVALVEAILRRAWLEVRFGGGETITVNLGPEPVKVGGDGRQCAVWVRGAAPVALRYWIRDGKVVCDDMASGGERLAANGDRWQAGGVEVIVRTASGSTPARGRPVAEPVAREARPLAKPVPPPQPAAPITAKPVASSQAAAKPVASPAVTKTPSKTISGYTCPECGSGVDKPVGVCPHCGAMY